MPAQTAPFRAQIPRLAAREPPTVGGAMSARESCTPPDDDPVYKHLVDTLVSALSAPHSSGILVTAPPGAGKTTLCQRAASATTRPVFLLRHSLLASPIAGDVEASVDAFFACSTMSTPSRPLPCLASPRLMHARSPP
jgi:ATPase family associated with various cellular activities (AAA)